MDASKNTNTKYKNNNKSIKTEEGMRKIVRNGDRII
jgi:hypothetical protein